MNVLIDLPTLPALIPLDLTALYLPELPLQRRREPGHRRHDRDPTRA